jgi:hypothetical protein
LIFRLALEGDDISGPMGVKAIVTYLNERRIFTRDGARWGIGQLYSVLTRTTYVGRHEFNRSSAKSGPKPAGEIVTVAVPPIIDQATFDAVQAHLHARNPKVIPARVVSGPTLLTGICFCTGCGGAMTLRTGKGGRYRYYTCSPKPGRAEPAARAARSRWTSSTTSLPSTWKAGCFNPSGWRTSWPPCSTAGRTGLVRQHGLSS